MSPLNDNEIVADMWMGFAPDSWQGPIMPSAGFDAAVSPIAALSSGIPAFAETAESNPGASLLDIIKAVGETYALTQQQKTFLKLNESLVAQGRNPIGWEQFGASTAVGVQVDSGTQKIVLGVGLALAAALALNAMRRR
jgi:hypothetical protein